MGLTEARRALDRGDLDAAGPLLARALRSVAAADEPAAATLVEQAAHLARWAHDPGAVVGLLDAALETFGSAVARARVLHARSRLDAFLARGDDRERHLRAAVAAYREGGDLAGVAIAQSDLAFPVGPIDSLAERRRLAASALDLARRSGDALALVVCAGTVARALVELGDDAAYAMWDEGRAALPAVGPLPPWAADVAPRYFYNWARILVLRGDYATAARVADEGKAYSSRHYWARSFAVVDAVRHWRLGAWAAARSCVGLALDGESQPGLDLARMVDAHLRYERDARPDTVPLEALAEDLVGDQNVAGPVALALLVRIRDVRREPRPHRGAATAIGDAVRMGRRIGWEDLLPATAAVAPAVARAELDRLSDTLPLGPRAAPALQHARGLLAWSADDLVAAAAAYRALGEPYLAASALASAALARHRSRLPSAALRQEAADLYRSVGADRSLASLLRGAAGARAVPGLRIPASQRFAGSPGLTKRESDVALLASRGHTAPEIAAELHVAVRTVYVHIQSVKAKLGVRRKSELVRLFDER
jgi:DNA-binding CsgD family transcriptional regulator